MPFAITPQHIRNWVAEQLPSVALPDECTLESLCAGPATQSLWQFLTTRVQSESNAAKAKAACLLAEAADGEQGEDQGDLQLELERVNAELQEVQLQIRHLQTGIEQDQDQDQDGKIGMRAEELQQGWDDILETVEKQVDQRVEQSLQACERVLRRGENDGEALEQALEEICEVVEELGETENDSGVDLGADYAEVEGKLEQLCASVGAERVSEILGRQAVGGLERMREAADGVEGEDVERVREEVGRDMVLRAFAEYEGVVREVGRGEERVKKELEQAGARQVGAEIEGERSVVAFCRKGRGGGREESGRLKLEVRKRNERIERMDKVGKRLVQGNRQMLRRGEQRWRGLDRGGAMGGSGVAAAQRVLNEAERAKHMGCSYSHRICAGGWKKVPEDLARVRVAQTWSREYAAEEQRRWYANVGELGLRAETAVDGAEDVGREMEEDMLEAVEEVVTQAQRCAEEEARLVEVELGCLERGELWSVACKCNVLN